MQSNQMEKERFLFNKQGLNNRIKMKLDPHLMLYVKIILTQIIVTNIKKKKKSFFKDIRNDFMT